MNRYTIYPDDEIDGKLYEISDAWKKPGPYITGDRMGMNDYLTTRRRTTDDIL